MINKRFQLTLAIASLCYGFSATAGTLIQNVRVFDGVRMLTPRTVYIDQDKIVDADFHGSPPVNAKIVDGKGRTLMPGLIDSHVHAYQYLDLPVLFGVTTEIDMFTSIQIMQNATAKMASGNNKEEADLFSAGILATSPHGHGTEYGFPIPTLEKPEQAEAWVSDRIKEGSYFIKIVMEPGSPGHPIDTLSIDTVKALVVAAHAHHKLAVVHISNLADARAAIEAGADGLAHLFEGEQISDKDLRDFVSLLKEKKAFVIPTFCVLESIAGLPPQDLINDNRITGLLDKSQLQALKITYGKKPDDGMLTVTRKITAALYAAHVPLLAGTDAGNQGTQYGASLHHEMASMVNAGMSPVDALAAATSVPAAAFHLADRGRIAKGYKADLILVDGDPSADISVSKSIVEVWKDGETVSSTRQQKYASVAQQAIHVAAPPSNFPADGRISLFSEKELASPFGSGWTSSTDSAAGGKSTVELKVLAAAASEQAALDIHANINQAFAFPWAGVAFMPGSKPMEAADLHQVNTLKFKVKGDGKQYHVSMMVQGSYIPVSVEFNADNDWKEVSIPFSRFKGVDSSIVTMIAFSAGMPAGEYRFQLSDVRLLKE